jgi:hypothetical protein
MKRVICFLSPALCSALLTACGAEDVQQTPEAPALPDSVGSIQQASTVAEDTCATAVPRDTLFTAAVSATSPNGDYDHVGCRHEYMGVTHSPASAPPTVMQFVAATYAGPITSPQFLGCSAMWVQLSVWQQTSGGLMRVEDPPIQYGYESVVNGVHTGKCVAPSTYFVVGQEADYLAVAKAGAIFTYEPVKLWDGRS